MLSIGEFSKINRITPKTLRHYEKLGLILPAKIDDWTGYRYYRSDQLPLIRRILLLKEMGFSLNEIREILNRQDQLGEWLHNRKEELSRELKQTRMRLDRVKEYLVCLEGGQDMSYHVELKSLPGVTVACMRTRVDSYDRFFEIVPLMGEYMQSVGAVCREPFYCFTIFHDGEYKERDIDVEICEAVVASCEDSEKIKFKPIKAVDQAACLMHKGDYASLGESYNALFLWISEEGLVLSGPPRESYIDGIWNKENPEDWLTEIQVPVESKKQEI